MGAAALANEAPEAPPWALDYGIVGDGLHDDAAALQRAVDAGVRTLDLGRGVYRISESILIDLSTHGPVGIFGESGAARIVMAGPGPALDLRGTHQGTANPQSVRPEIWERERTPIIREIEIVGDHPEADGICLQGTMQCTVTRVSIRRCRSALRLTGRNRNFILSESHIYDNLETGVFLDHANLHQINIIGNHISYCGLSGIRILNGEVRNLQITGNDIEYNHQLEQDAADILFDTREGTLREFTIASNTIQARPTPNGANIRIIGNETDSADQSGLASISGNLIASQTFNIDIAYARGVVVSGNSFYSAADLTLRAAHCRNLSITGNTVDYNPGVENQMRDGLLFESCDGVVISAASLFDCRWGGKEQGGAVNAIDCRNLLISGCVILNPAFRGVDLRRCRDCRIVNNIIADNRPQPTMIEAVSVDADSKNIVVEGNSSSSAAD